MAQLFTTDLPNLELAKQTETTNINTAVDVPGRVVSFATLLEADGIGRPKPAAHTPYKH